MVSPVSEHERFHSFLLRRHRIAFLMLTNSLQHSITMNDTVSGWCIYLYILVCCIYNGPSVFFYLWYLYQSGPTLTQSNTLWYSGLILGLHPSNERCRYKVTLSLIGWAQTYNQVLIQCKALQWQILQINKSFDSKHMCHILPCRQAMNYIFVIILLKISCWVTLGLHCI